MEKIAMQMGRKYRLEKIQEVKDEVRAKWWKKIETKICIGFAILAGSYFGVHIIIYLIRLSAGQVK